MIYGLPILSLGLRAECTYAQWFPFLDAWTLSFLGRGTRMSGLSEEGSSDPSAVDSDAVFIVERLVEWQRRYHVRFSNLAGEAS